MSNPLTEFVHSAGDIIKSGFELVPEDEQKRRLSICERCEHYSAGMCMLCFCVMKLKTKFVATECPIGRWTAFNGEPTQSTSIPVSNPSTSGGCGCGK